MIASVTNHHTMPEEQATYHTPQTDMPETTHEADHAVRHWNAIHEIGTEVVRVDDFGHLHKTVTTSGAWVMPSGTAVVMVEDMSGAYKLSRIWERSVFNEHVRPVDA